MDPLYHYAHRALQYRLLRETGFFESLIADKTRQNEWLDRAARETAELCGEPALARILSDLSAVYTGDVLGHPALIVELPPPQISTHCHFVAIFRGTDGRIRYYTLERAMEPDQPLLCCWENNGKHVLFGRGPKPEVAAFGAAIEKLEKIEQQRAEEAAAWQPTVGWATGLLPMSYFPHEALPHWLTSEPARFERVLADERERERWIDFGMEATASLTQMPPAVARAMQERIQVHHEVTIAGQPALIVEMPAQHVAECHFLAVFRRQDRAIRYYALERGMTPGQTMLCYRGADRSHHFIGDGPQPELAAFRDAVDEAERQANGGDPPSRPFPEGCPFHI